MTTVGTAGGNRELTQIYVGAAGGAKAVIEAWVGTAGGNRQFYSAETTLPLTVSISTSSVAWNDNGGTYQSPQIDAYPSGGVEPYAYDWGTDYADDRDGQSTTFTQPTNDALYVVCTVTDALGAVAYSTSARIS